MEAGETIVMVLLQADLEKIHDCEKCHGKIVMISVDDCGNTYCGYCNQRVPYDLKLEKKAKIFEGGKLNAKR